MLKKLFYFNRKRLIMFLAMTIILTICTPFMILPILPAIVDAPLLFLYPGMGETGKLVTYWYAGAIPKTDYGCLVFIVYHSFVSFIISGFFVVVKAKS